MGGWDYYCFICAAGFDIPFDLENDHEPSDSDEGGSENDHLDKPENLRPKKLFPKEVVFRRIQWLTKFRTIGQNPHASELTNCYITGPAEAEDYGEAIIQPGDHPNAQSLHDDRVHCYRNRDEENGDLPVHDNCFAILCKVFAYAQGRDFQWTSDSSVTSFPFELDPLFSCLASARRQYNAYLHLDHGFEPDQYFVVEWAPIFDYFDPLENVEMPPIDSDSVDVYNAPAATEPCSSGLFDTLPHELLVQILDYVPQEDLLPLMRASSTVRRAAKPSKFWQRRLRLDAPWLWECRDRETASNRNWQIFYNNVMMQACRPLHKAAQGSHVSGLANRQRIWHVCEQILQLYLETDRVRRPQQITSIFENGVVCQYLPMVASRSAPQLESEAAFFFEIVEDMALEKQLSLNWNTEDALCGIRLSTQAGKAKFGHVDDSPGRESIMIIQSHDWIEKLVLNISVIFEKRIKTQYVEKRDRRWAVTGVSIWLLSGSVVTLGRNDGHKRLLEPLPGNGIVGFKSYSSQGVITNLGLLEHSAGLTTSRPPNDPKRLKMLWNDHLPPTWLRFKDDYTGYWPNNRNRDLVPMHTLLFGSTDLEQSTMTGIGAASDLTYFELYRSDGSCEQIGYPQAPMKTFPVDGPGGERIAGFEWTIGHLPVGMTILTTNGRQAVFGKRNDNARHGHTSEHGYGVAGFYCSFGYVTTGKDLLSSLGLIQSQHIERPSMGDNLRVDENGLLWETQPPSPSWQAVGPVYGPGHQGEVTMCIDFSRIVTKIEGLFPAPEWLAEVEIGGFVIHYGDGNMMQPFSHLGFPPEQWPTAIDAPPESLRSMQRYPGMSMGFTRDVDAGEAHVLTDAEALAQLTTWNLGDAGEKLAAVSIWAGDYLHGLQFHSQSGKDSPRWGKCGGKPAATIRAGGEERIVGLKIILGARRLGHTAPNFSPQAVQAMSEAS